MPVYIKTNLYVKNEKASCKICSKEFLRNSRLLKCSDCRLENHKQKRKIYNKKIYLTRKEKLKQTTIF